FLLDEAEKEELVEREPNAAEFIHPYVGSEELINGGRRYCLWLRDIAPDVLRKLPAVMARVKAVQAFRLESKREATRKLAQIPTAFAFVSQPNGNFIAIPSVSSERRQYIPIAFFEPNVIASNLC